MKFGRIHLAAGALALAAATPVLAHHSGAMFDRNKDVTLVGTLKEVQWTNPHGWIEMMVAGADGTPQQWSIETGGPGGFVRWGFKKDPAYPAVGDKITVVAHPLRDGRRGGSFVSMIMPDGRHIDPNTPGQAGSAGGVTPPAPAAR